MTSGPDPGPRHMPSSRVLYGRALRDWFAGDRTGTLILHSSLGEHEELPVEVFFRGPDAFFPFERYALELCRGQVLDAGAGTGVHALALQERGEPVTAIEIVPEAAGIMRARGVRDVRAADLFEWIERGPPPGAGPFDTVLMMMNGVGPVGTLAGLARFFRGLPRLLSPGGRLLVDSADVRGRADEAGERPGEWRWPPPTVAAYPGEAWIRLEYRGEVGAPFRELYVDAGTMLRCASDAGWNAQLAFDDGAGAYLARFVLPG